MTFARETVAARDTRNASRKEANLRSLATPSRTLHRAAIARCDGAAKPIEKDPHTVNPHLRNLARGESCTGLRYGSYCHCDPATTVLAHTNTLSDAKGMGYKAHDHLGMFLGLDCHSWLDSGKGTAEEKAALVETAQRGTRERWAQIAADRTAKPWKQQAARWALEQLEARG